MLNPDGLESTRSLTLMPQPATHDVMSQQLVWAARPVHGVQRLQPSADEVSIESGLDTSIQIYGLTRMFSLHFLHAWLAVKAGAAPLDQRSLLDLA